MYEIILGRSEVDREKFGTAGTVYIGKQYVKMGRTTSLSNQVYLDVAKSHVVFICGKRGSGKCLHGDTLVTLDNGSMVPIKDLANDKNNIFGLNHRLKIVPDERKGFYEREVNELIHLKLRSGREIKLTPEHPLLKLEGWTPALDFNVGDRIATPRKLPCFGKKNIGESEVKILAYLIAEGHLGKKIFFTNKDLKIVEELRESLNNFDSNLALKKLEEGQYDIVSKKEKRKVLDYSIIRGENGRFKKGSWIRHEKTTIRELLERNRLYKVLSKDRVIPDSILQLPKHRLALFLNRLFSCDGSIYRKKSGKGIVWQVSYSTSSERLGFQIHSLLLRFGIISKLRFKKQRLNNRFFNTFEIIVSSLNVGKFIQEIGFFGEKESRQDRALIELRSLHENPNVDTVPKEIWKFYRPKSWVDVGREMNYSTPKAIRSSINYAPSRQKLLQVAMIDNNERVKAIAESDIFWDEVVFIEYLHGNFKVYDITVPEIHNFIANNIVVHNSYTMGVIAEGVADLPKEIKQNIAVVILDTMGIYWTMKYENQKDREILDEWGLQSKPLDVKIYTPAGFYKDFKEKGIPTDYPFSINPNDLEAADWCTIFEINLTDPIGVLIERTINKLKEKNADYGLDDIIKLLKTDDQTDPHVLFAAENRFENAKSWGLFSKQGTPLKDLVAPGQITVLDVSCYVTTPGASNIRALVIGLVAKKLFLERMIARRKEEFDEVYSSVHYFEPEKNKTEIPLVWLIIDEAHEFLPKEGMTVASMPLITILREGRQPGISLVLASQQPGKIHTDVMTQADITISHVITAKIDTDALASLTQTYMRESLDKQFSVLPKVTGSAVILDDMNERIYPVKIRPRFTWHGGAAPTAMKEVKKIFDV